MKKRGELLLQMRLAIFHHTDQYQQKIYIENCLDNDTHRKLNHLRFK